MSGIGTSFVAWLAELATRRAWLVIGVSLLLTALASYASTKLTLNSSTEDILAADLPFRQTERALQKFFPREEEFIVVLDAGSPAEARRAASALADRLRAKPSLFRTVEVPGLSPFFQKNAFLFMKPEQLQALGAQIGQARPLLTTMARDPSLRGLAGLFGGLQISAEATDIPEAMPRGSTGRVSFRAAPPTRASRGRSSSPSRSSTTRRWRGRCRRSTRCMPRSPRSRRRYPASARASPASRRSASRS
jgi:hypothetical protein